MTRVQAELAAAIEACTRDGAPLPAAVRERGWAELFDEKQALARLAELDAAFALQGTPLGLLPELEQRLARRHLAPYPRESWSVLPATLAERAALVESLEPRSVLVLDDIDGLSVALAAKHRVCAVADDATARWLQREADLAGRASRLDVARTPPRRAFDVVVVALGVPGSVCARLAEAAACLGAGGKLLVGCRSVCEPALVAWLEAARLLPSLVLRDAEVPLLPGGFAADDAGPLLLLEPTEGLPRLDTSLGVLMLDVDALSPQFLDESAPARLLDAVAAYAPRAEAYRHVAAGADGVALAWYDREGYGLVAELRAGETKLMAELLPYDSALEYALRCASLHTLGDTLSRFALQDVHRARAGELQAACA